jgi:hypothetical protein
MCIINFSYFLFKYYQLNILKKDNTFMSLFIKNVEEAILKPDYSILDTNEDI